MNQLLPNNGFSLTSDKLSLLSKFFISAGLASLLVAVFGLSRNIFPVFDSSSYTKWDCPCSILFYFPAGVILLIANQAILKSKILNWKLGGSIGFATYLSLHLITDIGTEFNIPRVSTLPLFLTFQVADILWGPIFHYILVTFGSVKGWIDVLGISWFATIPFVLLGILYASAPKSRWLSFLAIFLSVVYVLYCLLTLWTMWLISWMSN